MVTLQTPWSSFCMGSGLAAPSSEMESFFGVRSPETESNASIGVDLRGN